MEEETGGLVPGDLPPASWEPCRTEWGPGAGKASRPGREEVAAVTLPAAAGGSDLLSRFLAPVRLPAND